MSKQFEIRREVVLPATPEQVYAAITTGQANWMFPVPSVPARVAEPPERYEVRVDGEDGWFNALEYVIEAREGGSAVLRYVHSGVLTDDWDNQYDGASRHTDFYLHTLGEYLARFPGRTATYVSVSGPEKSSDPKALETLKTALGLTAESREGDAVRIDLPGLGSIETEVDYLNQYFVGLCGEDALYRFFGRNNFGGTVDAAHHLFGESADREKTEHAWRGWLEGVFAA
ncbi:MAG TPA: SRPBCC domain-containing protein [Amycolatopsis sp.]|uniref:SRPBCC domain-containing protein n=1 Tax=Amycolatopsis sp. TaxID=37632 RepID=UPI002B4609BF|nr:SRPBCC domain-containing protein [Amycolatopsis sp.]HKS49492.1 SRPBCC domain-containing protein [Amycolatopsis sp.]